MQLRIHRSYAPSAPRVVPPRRWGTGPPTQRKLADYLSKGCLPSVIGVEVDSILIDAIYGQHSAKAPNRRHDVKSLAPTPPETGADERKLIYETFEAIKGGLNFQISDLDYIKKTDRCSQDLFDVGVFSGNKEETTSVIRWSLIAYSMMLNAESLVRLRTITHEEGLEFAIHARKDLSPGLYMYELMGVMAADTDAEHSRLSEIHPHPSHKKGTAPRIWFGPCRFVNHDCKTWNAEVIAIVDTYAYSIRTTKAIKEGEQVFLNYGSDYFEDFPEGCPCFSCKGRVDSDGITGPSSSKRKEQPADPVEKNTKKSKKEINRARRKLGKKKGNVEGEGP